MVPLDSREVETLLREAGYLRAYWALLRSVYHAGLQKLEESATLRSAILTDPPEGGMVRVLNAALWNLVAVYILPYRCASSKTILTSVNSKYFNYRLH